MIWQELATVCAVVIVIKLVGGGEFGQPRSGFPPEKAPTRSQDENQNAGKKVAFPVLIQGRKR
jgi:hypothetical protein